MSHQEWDAIAVGTCSRIYSVRVRFVAAAGEECSRGKSPGRSGAARQSRLAVWRGSARAASVLAVAGGRRRLLIQELNAPCRRRGVRRSSHEQTGLTVSVSTDQDRAFFTTSGRITNSPLLLADSSARREMSRARHVHFSLRAGAGVAERF